MDYKEFVQAFTERLRKEMEQENVTMTCMTVNKVNRPQEAIAIKYPDETTAPLIYLGDTYERYCNGESLAALAKEEADWTKIMHSSARTFPIPGITQQDAQTSLYCVVVNAEMNKELLKYVPSEKIEDLAVIARYKVGEDSSTVVTYEMCRVLEMTPEEVMQQAHKNTEKIEYSCRTMSEVMRDMMVADGMDAKHAEELVGRDDGEFPMYILTNKETVDGAAAITCRNVMEQAHEVVGEDFYILPSSRHEVILIPDRLGVDAQELQVIVRQVNKEIVAPQDILSEHVYRYDSMTKKVSLADTRKLSETKEIAEKLVRPHRRSH